MTELDPPFSSETPAAPFVAQKSQDEDAVVLLNMEFFPDIELLKFQMTFRVDASHAPEKQIEALEQAMIKANRELLNDGAMNNGINWVCQQVKKGYFSLEAIPAIEYGDVSEKVKLYFSCIFAKAKQTLVEKYRDTDLTRSGYKTAGFEKDKPISNLIDDYEQEYREKLRSLMGKSRCTVDLI